MLLTIKVLQKIIFQPPSKTNAMTLRKSIINEMIFLRNIVVSSMNTDKLGNAVGAEA